MAQDMEQQAASLEELPTRFWIAFKKDEESLLNAIHQCRAMEVIDNKEDKSLHTCFVRTLNLEEPLIVSAYVPLIRLLRTQWSGHALDFYVRVKSHVTRISRIIQPFSIDPALIQRVQALQQRFEFEVQAPAIPVVVPGRKEAQTKRGRAPRHAAARKSRKAIASARTAKRTLSLRKRVQHLAKRAKPLVTKLDLARQRARR
jgi:hypothetical protein